MFWQLGRGRGLEGNAPPTVAPPLAYLKHGARMAGTQGEGVPGISKLGKLLS